MQGGLGQGAPGRIGLARGLHRASEIFQDVLLLRAGAGRVRVGTDGLRFAGGGHLDHQAVHGALSGTIVE